MEDLSLLILLSFRQYEEYQYHANNEYRLYCIVCDGIFYFVHSEL
jgi:hypothetical protein